jgi:hypothetical protein
MKGEVNWINVIELRNVDHLLCKIKCKYENQATKIAQSIGEKNEGLL